MELMIKDHKTGLNSDRTSCHKFTANQFLLFLHSVAYVVMHYLRRVKLKGTQLACAQFNTIRLRLLKIGARIESGRTRILLHFPQAFANLSEFRTASGVNTG